jgi:formate hydrogenlyase subunit 6/NADH:ubiquinone oxidoreductase subunit I
MLRKIRITLATICFVGVTLLFLDFTGSIHAWIGWMARIQFLPALLAVNAGIVVALLVLTMLVGRIYCSVICPLGVMQDIVARMGRLAKKNRYRYSPAVSWLRYAVLAVFIVCLAAGVGSVVALLAPYSSYGRMAQTLLSPIWRLGNNLLADYAEAHNSYAFYETDIWIRGIGTLAIAAGTFVVIAILAWRNGRTYCNTVCPVGTVLGFVAKHAFLRPTIDTSKCNGCGLCARNCKAACIDSKTHTIDYSRCVDCMDCLEKCRQKAIGLRYAKRGSAVETAVATEEPKAADSSRRTFLAGTAALAAATALEAKEKTVDGGLATILDKQVPKRRTPIVPPGAISLKHLRQHCTGCQLCVSVCPNNVLRPSTDLISYMQPESSYERGYCRPECTKCSEVCPAGAIKRIDRAEKSATQIGHAVLVKKNCLPLTEGISCGNCARHCPAEAIIMVGIDPNDPESVQVPTVNEEKCIGCGACENLCPARPFSAIYVEGHSVHRSI